MHLQQEWVGCRWGQHFWTTLLVHWIQQSRCSFYRMGILIQLPGFTKKQYLENQLLSALN